jgi:hypothetical protein
MSDAQYLTLMRASTAESKPSRWKYDPSSTQEPGTDGEEEGHEEEQQHAGFTSGGLAVARKVLTLPSRVRSRCRAWVVDRRARPVPFLGCK